MSDDILGRIPVHEGIVDALPSVLARTSAAFTRRFREDSAKISQKSRMSRLRAAMRERVSQSGTSHTEINWISETIATLPLERWTVESIEPDTWYFKVVLFGGIRVNIQVDGADDAFAAIYRQGVSVGLVHGTLKETIDDVRSYLRHK